MSPDRDHYEIFYADKLWALLPAVYRAQDTDNFNGNGPLRELVNRVGAQVATVRRSMDRLLEDQSIESCDDWVIAYIADLLATKLVASLDARGQRLDVAKTIYYRRRKGTVAVLEEIASDITGWDARVIEFFRRLGRQRHNFDPALADLSASPADSRALAIAQGLTGGWTSSSIGGWADLRNAYGASQAQGPDSISRTLRPPSAFDEYFHTADFRAGRGRSGWYNIPKLGVFLWRLISFGVDQTTPVQSGSCYTFDPTGRRAPLFAASSRPLGDDWVSPQEWQVAAPISTPVLAAALRDRATYALYAAIAPDGVTLQPNSVGVFTKPGSFYELVDGSEVTTFPEGPGGAHAVMIFPETGEFGTLHPLNGSVTVTYHYGFSAPLGAGPYDRRVLGQTTAAVPNPITVVSGGGGALSTLVSLPPIGTISMNDSLTYDSVPDAPNVQQLTVTAQNSTRPVIRCAAPGEWVLTGGADAVLVLEGLFLSGCDVVLRGEFAQVTLRCCTFDPGSAALPSTTGGSATPVFAQSIDGRDLRPTRLWIEGQVQELTVDRCILGPVRTRAGGEVETLDAGNSLFQAIPTASSTSPDLVFEFHTGQTNLTRCTVLGPAEMHELEASECILAGVISVENYQRGCVRFSAWSLGSQLPRQYESVQIPAPASLFTSHDFGQPGYGQLRDSADHEILTGATGATISAGAEDGSEMGAFAGQKNGIKERAILTKFEEYMPLGLTPVLIRVT